MIHEMYVAFSQELHYKPFWNLESTIMWSWYFRTMLYQPKLTLLQCVHVPFMVNLRAYYLMNNHAIFMTWCYSEIAYKRFSSLNFEHKSWKFRVIFLCFTLSYHLQSTNIFLIWVWFLIFPFITHIFVKNELFLGALIF